MKQEAHQMTPGAAFLSLQPHVDTEKRSLGTSRGKCWDFLKTKRKWRETNVMWMLILSVAQQQLCQWHSVTKGTSDCGGLELKSFFLV